MVRARRAGLYPCSGFLFPMIKPEQREKEGELATRWERGAIVAYRSTASPLVVRARCHVRKDPRASVWTLSAITTTRTYHHHHNCHLAWRRGEREEEAVVAIATVAAHLREVSFSLLLLLGLFIEFMSMKILPSFTKQFLNCYHLPICMPSYHGCPPWCPIIFWWNVWLNWESRQRHTVSGVYARDRPCNLQIRCLSLGLRWVVLDSLSD